jgi:hypothetical protein
VARDRVAAAEARTGKTASRPTSSTSASWWAWQRRIGHAGTAADTSAGKATALAAEAALRAQLSPDLAETEQVERGTWHEERQREAAERHAQQAERALGAGTQAPSTITVSL